MSNNQGRLPPIESNKRNNFNNFDEQDTQQNQELLSLKPQMNNQFENSNGQNNNFQNSFSNTQQQQQHNNNLEYTNPFNQPQVQVQQNTRQNQLQGRGDVKPEVYFIGQLVGGINFGQNKNDGLFCELTVESSYHWQLLSSSKSIQTQTSYASDGEMNVWSHPLEIAFSSSHISNWPKGIIQIWRLDQNNKIDIYAYGIFNFPKQQGHSRIECQTWSPIGQYNQQDIFNSLSFFMGNNPRLNQVDVVQNNQDQRRNIKSVSNGTVILEINTLMKNYQVFDLSGQY